MLAKLLEVDLVEWSSESMTERLPLSEGFLIRESGCDRSC